MLKYRLESLEGVDAAIATLYKEVEENGKKVFQLQVEGAVAKERLDDFRNNNIALRKVEEDRRKAWGDILDMDPESVRAILQRKEDLDDAKLIEKGKVDQVVTQRTAKLVEEHNKQLAAVRAERDSAIARLSFVEINQAVVNTATKRGLRPTAIPDITARARTIFKLKDGKPTAFEEDGTTPKYGKDANPLSIEEWVEAQTAEAPHLFEASSGGGAGGDGSGGARGSRTLRNPWKGRKGDPSTGWSLTEQMRIIKSDPSLAKRLQAEAGVA